MTDGLKICGFQRRALAVVLPALLCAGLACGGPGTGPSASARATGLALTAEAVLTGTAAAIPVPTRTTTPSPTHTSTATVAQNTATATVTQPTSTPAPTECPKDDSNFVTDVTIPDGTHFAPGTAFNKTWRLRNSGPCTWTTKYQFQFASGEAMGGATVNLPGVVAPGATVDITVSFVAPAEAGTHRGTWRMVSPGGVAFGTEPSVEIKVP
jgi:hypothetical protein